MYKNLSTPVKIIIILLGCIGASCHQNKPHLINAPADAKIVKTDTVTRANEDFNAFHNQFTSDSLFQLSRVQFPLKGWSDEDDIRGAKLLPKELKFNDSLSVNLLWQKKGWLMQHTLTDTAYRRVLSGDKEITVEKIYLPDSEVIIHSVFRNINNRWFLVYYSESF